MSNISHLRATAGILLIAIALTAPGCGSAAAPVAATDGAPREQVVRITAKRFEYEPAEVHVKRGVPAVLELTSLDRVHGFAVPELGLRSDIPPGVVTKLRFVPDRAGHFDFHCDVFCGSGHEEMGGAIVVDD